jgi:hypothetical protein
MQRSPWRSAGILFCALPAFAAGLGQVGCGSSGGSEPAALGNVDASYCEPGTLSCFCDSAGNCDVGLVCDVGRCFGSEGESQTLDPTPAIPIIPGRLPSDVLDAGSSAPAPARDAAAAVNASDAGDAGANDAGADASSGAPGPA